MDHAERQSPHVTLFSESVPLDLGPGVLDLIQVRQRFAELFDRAARAVFLAGYDLDDVIVERYLDCRIEEQPSVRVAAEPLSDDQRLWAHIARVLATESGGEPDLLAIEIVGVTLITVLDREA